MKVLVTGANGYLGIGVVRELIKRGCEVVATDFEVNEVDTGATLMPANIFEIDNPYEYFGKPDAVLHLAWRDGFKHQSPNHMLDLPGHYIFLEKLISAGISKVAVMGSMHEIGRYEGEINEDTPTNPLSLYGISKDALRRSIELLKMNHSFVFQWIRGFYIVSNTEKGCSIFSKLVQAEHKGDEEFPFTMGTNQYDFIPYEEMCAQMAAVVCQDKVTGIINCCSGTPVSLRDEVEKFITDNKFSIRLKYGVFPEREYDSKAVWGNTDKISAIMNDEYK